MNNQLRTAGKVGIVGSGFVGATAAYAMVLQGVGREIVLVDLNQKRAAAEADDVRHAVPFAQPVNVHPGDYPDLAGAQVVVITAGVNQRPGETRLQLLERNAAVFADVVPKVLAHALDAVLVIATNPVDIMTHMAAHFAAPSGVPASRVIGSGTTLDTARFRTLLSGRLGVDARHVHAYVMGEHGDSEVLAWSQVIVGGLSLETYCQQMGIDFGDGDRAAIDRQVRNAAYSIIEGKGATYYGIGAALAHIVDVLLRDRRAILTVCTPQPQVESVSDVTVALPHLVGGAGILDTLYPALSEAEHQALDRSASVVREAIDSLLGTSA
ncbi:MAG: L-lactate dehydrogenase [Caldilineae bacterium]|nr:MAG: L-lactate dehydrogenase [Caldilineae bacterium]